jgi:hypothetical protein
MTLGNMSGSSGGDDAAYYQLLSRDASPVQFLSPAVLLRRFVSQHLLRRFVELIRLECRLLRDQWDSLERNVLGRSRNSSVGKWAAAVG